MDLNARPLTESEGIKPSRDDLDSNNSNLVNVSSAPRASSTSTSNPTSNHPPKHLYSSVTSSENQELASYPPGLYSLSTQTILESLELDVTRLWKLSSCGPSNHEPNLISGLDISQEELRYHAWLRTKEGRAEEIPEYEKNLIDEAQKSFQKVLDDPEAALQTANANTQRAISERMGLARNVSPFDWDSLDPDPSSSKPETRSNRPDETAEKERELINEAQEALDRLDFKTAEEICTEALESAQSSDPTSFLLIRSEVYQRRGCLDDSLKDLTRALELGVRTDECQLRLTYLHLRLTLRHLGSHQKETEKNLTLLPNSESSRPSRSTSNLAKLLLEAKKEDRKNPFRRLSTDLFLKLIQFCQAQTILTCGQVCSDWSRTLFEHKSSVFSVFRMKDKETFITRNLELFNLRSGRSIKEIDIELIHGFEPSHAYRKFQNAMICTYSTLKSLSIKHYGGAAPWLSPLIRNCRNLKSLHFIELGNLPPGGQRSTPSEMVLAEPWPLLEVLEWKCSSWKLAANQALLDSLKQAKSVTLSGGTVPPRFIIDLLTSTPTLEVVDLNGIRFDPSTQLEKEMKVGCLTHLSLDSIPVASDLFFKHLDAPRLQVLHLEETDFGSLELLRDGRSLVEFKVGKLSNSFLIGSNTSIDSAVRQLLRSMRFWNSLKTLRLELSPTSFGSYRVYQGFFLQLISALTPLSKDRLRRSDEINSIILPSLSFLKLGSPHSESKVDKSCSNGALALACLLSGRRAAFEGRSKAEVLAASNGFFFEPSAESEIFSRRSTLGILSSLEKLEVWVSLAGDKGSIDTCRRLTSSDSVLSLLDTLQELEKEEVSVLLYGLADL